jgi:hypothetical protein
VEELLARGAAAKELGKEKSAIVKLGVLLGKGRSFMATIRVVGKGGRVRTATVSRGLYEGIEERFRRSLAPSLAERRGCPQALRRATLAVGGRSTGSHAHRRTSATELKNRLYWGYAKEGLPAAARPKAGAEVGLPPAAGRTSRPRTSPEREPA